MPVAGDRSGRRVLIPIGLVAFITSLDATVVTNAAPSIQKDLGLSLSDLEWVATNYIFAFASLLLVGGRLTDMIGRRRVLVTGMWVFMIASVVIALADGGGLMLFGRLLQGTGAALIVPAVLSILASDVEGEDRHIGAAVYTMAIASSLALGPVVGGALSQYADWSYIFWMNIPIVLLAWVATEWAVPATGAKTPINQFRPVELLQRLDVPGLVLSSLALGAITFALVEGPKPEFPKSLVVLSVLVAVGALVGAVVVERRAPFPLVDVAMLSHKVVAGGTAVQVLWGLGINGVFFFTSLYMQKVMGYSPSGSGAMFVPMAITLIVSVPISVKLATKIGAHGTVAIGMLAVTAGLVWSTFIHPGSSLLQIMPGLLLIGFGSALTTPMTSATLEMVPPSRAGVVSAVISVSREISGVLGIAMTGAVVAFRSRALESRGVSENDAFLSGYHWGLWLGAVASLAGAWIAWKTLRPGQEMLPELDLDMDMETDGDGPQSPATGVSRPSRAGPFTGGIPISPLIWPEPPRGSGRHRAPDPVPVVPPSPAPTGVDNLADLAVDLQQGMSEADWEATGGNGKHRA